MRRLAIALVLIACSDQGPSADLLARFSSSSHGLRNPDFVPAIAAVGRRDSIVIAGEVVAPCANYSLRAKASLRGRTLTLTIEQFEPLGQAVCFDEWRRHSYEAILTPLPDGDYTCRVRQTVFQPPDRWHLRTVLDTLVHVS